MQQGMLIGIVGSTPEKATDDAEHDNHSHHQREKKCHARGNSDEYRHMEAILNRVVWAPTDIGTQPDGEKCEINKNGDEKEFHVAVHVVRIFCTQIVH